MLKEALTHPKMRRLCAALRPMLGNSPVSSQTICVGLLERLWHYTANNHRDGVLRGVDAALLAEEIGWQDDADRLLAALIQVGWIDLVGDQLAIHDWADHCPRWVKGAVARSAQAGMKQAEPKTGPEEAPLVRPEVAPQVKPQVMTCGRTSQDIEHIPRPSIQTQEAEASVLSPPGTLQREPSRERPPKTATTEGSEEFRRFWAAYPATGRQRSGKVIAWQAWVKSGASDKPELAMQALEAAKKSRQWQQNAGEFVPGTHLWLNRGSWQDVVEIPLSIGQIQIASNAGAPGIDYAARTKYARKDTP